MKDFMFYPMGFVENLKWMGLGLLGTFLVIGIIIGVTTLFNRTANRLAEKKQEKTEE
ncbi:MAG: hypothetical protein J6T24_00110 [Clostridia bacterium]|nr:hypothetical protein [Clostridia bacterium]